MRQIQGVTNILCAKKVIIMIRNNILKHLHNLHWLITQFLILSETFIKYDDDEELKETTKFFKAAQAEGWGVKPVSLFAEDELPDSIMLVVTQLTWGDITTWLEETWLTDWRRHDYCTWLEETWLPDWRRHGYLTGGDMTTWQEETWLTDWRRHDYCTWLEETWLPDRRRHDCLTGGDMTTWLEET